MSDHHPCVLVDIPNSYDVRNDKPSGPTCIDIELAWLIRRLNHEGIRTLYCCQGGKELDDAYTTMGYVTFIGWDNDQFVRDEIEGTLGVTVSEITHDHYPVTGERRTYMGWRPL